MNYTEFIKSKTRTDRRHGFEPQETNIHLFDWQRRIVEWSVRRGRASIFAECGLGKTLMQLDWAKECVWKTGLPVMLHCPVGVREQTLAEARKFGVLQRVGVKVCDAMDDVKPETICLVNYEKLHKFDPRGFGGVVLDESSILKNFAGKVKQQILDSWENTTYRLACTATPAPNDYVELGTHAEFMGVMSREQMLSRWFVNDTANTGSWRLKGHAQRDFWEWVSSWAICVSKPSDIGGSDAGFDLPDLIENIHCVTDDGLVPEGMLFNNFELSATNVHQQKRATSKARAQKVAELVDDQPWVIWCDTNYEADQLAACIPNAVDVRGSDSDKKKSEKLAAFSSGETKHLITKPSVAGFGMNWQHCSNMAFVGLSYSFESYYQAVRRCWRFGQKKPVNVHIVETDGEAALRQSIRKKQRRFQQMKTAMADAVVEFQLQEDEMLGTYQPELKMETPQWLTS